MAARISELWDKALQRFEEESKKATENLRRGVERARDAADLEKVLRETYERVEKSLKLFPGPKEFERLSDRIEQLSDRVADLEVRYGGSSAVKKKASKKKKSAKKKSSKKKSKKKKSKKKKRKKNSKKSKKKG